MSRAGPSRGVHATLAGLILAAIVVTLAAPSAPSARAASSCTGWSSESSPPPTIRVLRTKGPATATVAVVPFRDYVATVMPAEWSGGPAAAMQVGAIAVKQYAWYWTMHWRGHTGPDGSCYDVVDSTIDQVFAPETQQPTQPDLDAIEATWSVTLRQSGQFFATGYREGSDVACGADADGELLYQVSLYRCAAGGMGRDAVLHRYLDPGLQIVSGTPPPPSPTLSIAATAQLISWGQAAAFSVKIDAPAGSHASPAKRAIRLETSIDGLAWSGVATATSDAGGAATAMYRPATTLQYRAVFDAATDLGPATSQTVRVVVRQIAVLRSSAPAARGGKPGKTFTFTVTVRPSRPGVPGGTVAYELWRNVRGAFAAHRIFTRVPTGQGVSSLAVHLSPGTWGIRVEALPTTLNANSVWTAVQLIEVR